MSNVLNRLGSVLNSTHRSIVKVISVSPNGTSLVEHSDGSTSSIIGNGVQSGGNAYIENDRIVGPAPDLPFYDIEI
ncbi:hypothetical protein [Pseudoalteromonas xiamenensis]